MTDPFPARTVTIDVGDTTGSVSGLLIDPGDADTVFVFAHGAGAGMHHPFMERVSMELAVRQVATLRYQFPYMEADRKVPDGPNRAVATVRAAVATAREACGGHNLTRLAGGKSFGGRMTSTAAARREIDVDGLVFLGFPLHAPNKPSNHRAEHLSGLEVPMLFLQGTRDALADLDSLRPVLERLGPRATLHVVEGGDHSFKVLKRSGRTQDEVFAELADTIRAFADRV